MAAITTRAAKGSKLTQAEVDANFSNLNSAKLEGTEYAANNTILFRDKDGNLTYAVISEIQVVGRLTGGNVKGLSIAELKTILALEINDVALLQDELDALADAIDLEAAALDARIDTLETDLPVAESAIDALEAAINGCAIFGKGTDTLVAGEKAVALPGFLTTDHVVAFTQTPGGTVGFLHCSAKEAGGFTITSSSNLDTSTFFYMVIRTA